MAYPSDSTIDSQPVADQSGQGSSYAAFYDQIYSNPPTGGAGGESASFSNQSFAPDQAAAAVLPPYEDLPTDQTSGPESTTLLPEGAAGQEELNPWDTYVMDPTATGGEAAAVPSESSNVPGDALVPPADGSAAQFDAATPEEALAQVEQHLTQKFDEVVQLGTATPLDQQQFCTAVTDLVQTAELMGAFRAMAQGGNMQPGNPGMQPGAEALPTEEQVAMQPEALPTEEQVAMQPMPTDPSGGQFQVNPYEPQVPPVSSEAMAVPQEFAAAGGEPLAQLQEQLGSQITQLMSFTTASQMNTSLPSGGPLEGGNVDNFKTALLNVVKTAEQIGSIAQTSQPA